MLKDFILTTEIQTFIQKNLLKDTSEILLNKSLSKEFDLKEIANQILARRKAQKKLPTWFTTQNIYYPNKLSIEQTSSEITANYKSGLVTGNSLIDITGGFGVDAYYFSKHFDTVTHCEIQEELSAIVSHNLKALNVTNINTVCSDGVTYLNNTITNFDCIYIDPSRRNDTKGKVFLIEDCIPDIPKHLDILLSKSKVLMIKYSPMLDIHLAIKTLQHVFEVHIVSINNEVKELLFLLKENSKAPIAIKAIDFGTKETHTFNFKYNSAVRVTYKEPELYLYEPNAAILKSGGFSQISDAFKLFKLHLHSHLYTSNQLINFPGRAFKIIQSITYNKKLLKKVLPSDKANITTRNFPKTVAQIRKETKIKDGGSTYLFFTKDLNNKNIVIICERIN